MLIIGLAGLQGTGKDTVANYLRDKYGFIKFAFSDPLYAEVQEAYGLENQSLLRDRAHKEIPLQALSFRYCQDVHFPVVLGYDCGAGFGREVDWDQPRSPRQILQWWGTNYRRAQDPDYWVLKTGEWLAALRSGRYPEHRPQFFVECGTRFENERAWIKGFEGQIWHIHRRGVVDTTGHVSAQPLPVHPGERELHNNDTIERLHYGIDLLLRTPAPRVFVEPPMTRDEMNAMAADVASQTGAEHAHT